MTTTTVIVPSEIARKCDELIGQRTIADVKHGVELLLQQNLYIEGASNSTNGKNLDRSALLKRGLHMLAESPFETLGLPLTAKTQEIRKAYKKNALKYHPDKNPQTTPLFQVMHEMLDKLSDREKRVQEVAKQHAVRATVPSSRNTYHAPASSSHSKPQQSAYNPTARQTGTSDPKPTASSAAPDPDTKAGGRRSSFNDRHSSQSNASAGAQHNPHEPFPAYRKFAEGFGYNQDEAKRKNYYDEFLKEQYKKAESDRRAKEFHDKKEQDRHQSAEEEQRRAHMRAEADAYLKRRERERNAQGVYSQHSAAAEPRSAQDKYTYQYYNNMNKPPDEQDDRKKTTHQSSEYSNYRNNFYTPQARSGSGAPGTTAAAGEANRPRQKTPTSTYSYASVGSKFSTAEGTAGGGGAGSTAASSAAPSIFRVNPDGSVNREQQRRDPAPLKVPRPYGLRTTTVGSSTVELEWRLPLHHGNKLLVELSWRMKRSTTANSSSGGKSSLFAWESANKLIGTGICRKKNLTPGGVYEFRVRAVEEIEGGMLGFRSDWTESVLVALLTGNASPTPNPTDHLPAAAGSAATAKAAPPTSSTSSSSAGSSISGSISSGVGKGTNDRCAAAAVDGSDTSSAYKMMPTYQQASTSTAAPKQQSKYSAAQVHPENAKSTTTSSSSSSSSSSSTTTTSTAAAAGAVNTSKPKYFPSQHKSSCDNTNSDSAHHADTAGTGGGSSAVHTAAAAERLKTIPQSFRRFTQSHSTTSHAPSATGAGAGSARAAHGAKAGNDADHESGTNVDAARRVSAATPARTTTGAGKGGGGEGSAANSEIDTRSSSVHSVASSGMGKSSRAAAAGNASAAPPPSGAASASENSGVAAPGEERRSQSDKTRPHASSSDHGVSVSDGGEGSRGEGGKQVDDITGKDSIGGGIAFNQRIPSMHSNRPSGMGPDLSASARLAWGLEHNFTNVETRNTDSEDDDVDDEVDTHAQAQNDGFTESGPMEQQQRVSGGRGDSTIYPLGQQNQQPPKQRAASITNKGDMEQAGVHQNVRAKNRKIENGRTDGISTTSSGSRRRRSRASVASSSARGEDEYEDDYDAMEEGEDDLNVHVRVRVGIDDDDHEEDEDENEDGEEDILDETMHLNLQTDSLESKGGGAAHFFKHNFSLHQESIQDLGAYAEEVSEDDEEKEEEEEEDADIDAMDLQSVSTRKSQPVQPSGKPQQQPRGRWDREEAQLRRQSMQRTEQLKKEEERHRKMETEKKKEKAKNKDMKKALNSVSTAVADSAATNRMKDGQKKSAVTSSGDAPHSDYQSDDFEIERSDDEEEEDRDELEHEQDLDLNLHLGRGLDLDESAYDGDLNDDQSMASGVSGISGISGFSGVTAASAAGAAALLGRVHPEPAAATAVASKSTVKASAAAAAAAAAAGGKRSTKVKKSTTRRNTDTTAAADAGAGAGANAGFSGLFSNINPFDRPALHQHQLSPPQGGSRVGTAQAPDVMPSPEQLRRQASRRELKRTLPPPRKEEPAGAMCSETEDRSPASLAKRFSDAGMQPHSPANKSSAARQYRRYAGRGDTSAAGGGKSTIDVGDVEREAKKGEEEFNPFLLDSFNSIDMEEESMFDLIPPPTTLPVVAENNSNAALGAAGASAASAAAVVGAAGPGNDESRNSRARKAGANEVPRYKHPVRSEPSEKGRIVGYLMVGVGVLAAAECGDWMRVKVHIKVDERETSSGVYKRKSAADALKEAAAAAEAGWGWCLLKTPTHRFLTRAVSVRDRHNKAREGGLGAAGGDRRSSNGRKRLFGRRPGGSASDTEVTPQRTYHSGSRHHHHQHQHQPSRQDAQSEGGSPAGLSVSSGSGSAGSPKLSPKARAQLRKATSHTRTHPNKQPQGHIHQRDDHASREDRATAAAAAARGGAGAGKQDGGQDGAMRGMPRVASIKLDESTKLPPLQPASSQKLNPVRTPKKIFNAKYLHDPDSANHTKDGGHHADQQQQRREQQHREEREQREIKAVKNGRGAYYSDSEIPHAATAAAAAGSTNVKSNDRGGGGSSGDREAAGAGAGGGREGGGGADKYRDSNAGIAAKRFVGKNSSTGASSSAQTTAPTTTERGRDGGASDEVHGSRDKGHGVGAAGGKEGKSSNGGHAVPVWEELQDAHGNNYYYNASTGVSSWDPPHWVQEFDPASGSNYYVDMTSESFHTTWTQPREFAQLVRHGT